MDEAEEGWLTRFHLGERATLSACYRAHFDVVFRAAAGIVDRVDQESVAQEVFARLIASEEMRRGFRGGSLAAWLRSVARNQAIDLRRRQRERVDERALAVDDRPAPGSFDASSDAKMIVEAFVRDVLPPAWRALFQLRFIEQLDQRQVAARLGISRVTLALRERRIRSRLRRFLLEEP